MIKKIVIRDVASYDKEGVVLDDLQKVNFIYGGNGTGKTTISRVLGNENRKEEFPNCEIKWKGDELPILVYNKDFRDRNIAEYMPGIFTMGADAVKAEKEMEKLHKELNDYMRKAGEARDNAEKCDKDIEKEQANLVSILWQMVYMPNRRFKKCLGEAIEQEAFANKLIKMSKNDMLKKPSNQKEIDLNKRNKNLYSKDELERWKELGSIDYNEKVVSIERHSIWKRQVVESKDVPMKEFVRDDILIADFKKMFDDRYDEDIVSINELRQQYGKLVEGIERNAKTILEEGSAMEDYLLDTNDFDKKITMLTDHMKSNLTLMKEKYSYPRRKIELEDTSILAKESKEVVELANEKIRLHNKKVKQQSNDRRKLRNDVWRKLAWDAKKYVEESERLIADKMKDKHAYERAEKKARADWLRVETEISEKHKEIVSIQPTVDHINHALKHFGFTGFSIQPSKELANHYQIERSDGTLAMDTLREGEVTFISFLYFIQMTKAVDQDRDTVVVIDDPISSLDSSVLFVVGTMVRELLEGVRKKPADERGVSQAFVLTHNVYFHKETSFVNIREKKRGDTHYWILYKHGNRTTIKAFDMENPIRSSYDLLWKELRDWKYCIEDMDNIRLQNVLRRIIENYFVIFGGKKRWNLIPENFTDDTEERWIAMSFARWYDEGSHDIMDDMYVEAPQVLNEKYIKVFKMIFEKLGHGAHYEMMMGE